MLFSFEDDPDVTSDDVIVMVGSVESNVHSNMFDTVFPFPAASVNASTATLTRFNPSGDGICGSENLPKTLCSLFGTSFQF